eukprot:1637910-Rhodomonas_salina.1
MPSPLRTEGRRFRGSCGLPARVWSIVNGQRAYGQRSKSNGSKVKGQRSKGPSLLRSSLKLPVTVRCPRQMCINLCAAVSLKFEGQGVVFTVEHRSFIVHRSMQSQRDAHAVHAFPSSSSESSFPPLPIFLSSSLAHLWFPAAPPPSSPMEYADESLSLNTRAGCCCTRLSVRSGHRLAQASARSIYLPRPGYGRARKRGGDNGMLAASRYFGVSSRHRTPLGQAERYLVQLAGVVSPLLFSAHHRASL